MPKPGDILLYKDYVFEDGSQGDKLFVVLNNTDTNSPCLLLKTTSQPKRYQGVKAGCNYTRNVFFVTLTMGQNCFDCDTYIQLPQIIELPIVELLKGGLANKIARICCLSSGCFAQLRNCLRNFREDLSDTHWKLIF